MSAWQTGLSWLLRSYPLLLLFSHSVVSDPLRVHGLQHTRLPCPSPSPAVCSNSCPLSRCCHPTISSSVTAFSSCPQSLSYFIFLHSIVATGLEKVSFHSNPKERNAKECSNYRTIALISHTSKVMLKILQARLQQYVNHELTDVQAGFRKGRGTRDQLLTSTGSSKKQESSRKTSISALLTMPKPLTVWITMNCRKFFKRWEYQTTWPASWEICMQVRKQQVELDVEQQTGSK